MVTPVRVHCSLAKPIAFMLVSRADLATGLLSVLTDIVWKSTVEWHAGNAGCKIIKYLQVRDETAGREREGERERGRERGGRGGKWRGGEN